jgi:hypothetical protein
MNRAALSPWTATRFASPPMLDVGFDQASRPTTYDKRYMSDLASVSLAATPGIDPRLVRYANSARCGYVL